jgi:hypothetical protein
MVADDENPYSGVVLHYKVDKVPMEQEVDGNYYYYMQLEQKVENGAWERMEGCLTEEMVEGFYEESPGHYYLTDTWPEDYSDKTVSYRIRMAIDDTDAFTEAIAATPWSNIVTIGFKASNWAKAELQKAIDANLIPDILQGADLTKPINREEFAELSLRLYEKVTDKKAEPVVPNPFNDTTNPQILKAFKLGITSGTSKTTFSPKILINREQCATMLFSTIKSIKPDGDYSIVGVKDFPDQKFISGWAVNSVRYIAKINVIVGDAYGNFMPKATTTVQEAAGYGMATREAAIIMSVRTLEKMEPSQP